MAAIANANSGLSSFERELICSICTEVLYQPLTILNCLHTFCGSCLKEWFSHQHRKASSSRSSTNVANPYSCPTCRSEVRDVQHNATVSNLLDLFLLGNPGRDRSAEEKEDMDKLYKPGDKILPKVERRRERRTRREHSDAARDAQLVEQVRQRTLRDMENSTFSNTLAPPSSDRGRSASADREERRQRRRERERQREHAPGLSVPNLNQTQQQPDDETLPTSSPRHPDAVEARQREHMMSHQASLRSLVSASESGTGTGDSLDQARIMQEILDEGLLEGIDDVEALTEAEQDALAERIAEMYRQRHASRQAQPSSPPRQPRPLSNSGISTQREVVQSRPEQHRRSASRQRNNLDPASAVDPEARSRSHSSRPHQPPPSAIVRSNSSGSNVTFTHRRRTSDQTRQPRTANDSRRSSRERPPASMSASNLSAIQNDTATRERPPISDRTNTDPIQPPKASDMWSQAGGEDRRRRNATPPLREIKQMHPMPLNPAPFTGNQSSPESVANIAELDGTSVSAVAGYSTNSYEEPVVHCFRCHKPDIQYEIYRHCRACKVDLCMRCYRDSKGCKHWYGFGHAAEINFERAKTTDESTELPHVLIGRRYQRPPGRTTVDAVSSPPHAELIPQMKIANPKDRLQEGHFCDRCGTFANSQFWLCDICNEGEWGFCKQCVQTHHCCTHPLLPVAYVPQSQTINHAIQNLLLSATNANPSRLDSVQPFATSNSPSAQNSRPLTPNSATSISRSRRDSGYDYLSINVNCDMCHNIIFPASSRYHCPFHPTDFDVCTSCYNSYLTQSRRRQPQGSNEVDLITGWRKCPSGHRMTVLAFETDETEGGDGGMRRVVKHDLVGGWKMSEADIRAWDLQYNNHSHHTPPTSPPLNSRGTWSWKEDPMGTRRGQRVRASTLISENSNATAVKNSSLRFPPDGGVGGRGVAYYAYWPEEGEEGEGELVLPRSAEVSEIEDVNGDWWSGVYAGDVGVGPFGYVREVR